MKPETTLKLIDRALMGLGAACTLGAIGCLAAGTWWGFAGLALAASCCWIATG